VSLVPLGATRTLYTYNQDVEHVRLRKELQ